MLRTPRWLLFGLLAIALAVGMVFLGVWQLHRYQLRASINDRIDRHAAAAPVAGTDRILPAGRSPSDTDEYLRVRLIGRYDPAHQMLARVRTVNGNVGYEILTPLRRADGTAVLVDRGWLPPADPDGAADPKVPAAPGGEVTVVGQVRLPESGGSGPTRRNGHVEVRRIDPRLLASAVPYPIAGGYVTATSQTPALSPRFVPIPIDHQNAAMNLSYILQWWLFSGMALVGFVLLMRWESRKRAGLAAPGDRSHGARSAGPAARGGSRLPEDEPGHGSGRARGESRLPEDTAPSSRPGLPDAEPPAAPRPVGTRRRRNESRLPEDNVATAAPAVPDRSSRLPEDHPGTH
ncbi:SURF1 family protein [Actinocatenispora sera]|uniref:SURF1 family cytochrome oxidase biogenesis protein n=1 Tax=Actinocatenispora sera TaxID=390989 RepID=UPI00068FFD46|nr:SURF1 family protein [Actinocatenispora sera]